MEIQKAKHLHLEMEKKKPDIEHVYMVFEKHDGWFGYIDLPGAVIYSRAHREIPSLRELTEKIQKVRPNVRGRLIFEIMLEGYEVDRFHELNGIINRKTEQAEGAYILVHDFIPNFRNCTMKAAKRYAFAEEIVQKMGIPEVRMSPVLKCSANPDVWKECAEKVWAAGREGVILKRADGMYEAGKRNAGLMKIKEEVAVEMLVVAVEEGTGEHTGMVGKLICKDEVGQKHEIGCGTATHVERASWWDEPTNIIGKVVEIRAMKKLRDGSYREPRFKSIRYDKEVHELGY